MKRILKKLLLALLTISSPSLAGAQDLYVGGGTSLLVVGFADVFPYPSIQIGGNISPDFGFRVTLDTNLSETLIGGDALYFLALADPEMMIYLGGGLDVFIVPFFGRTALLPGLHATAGFEYRFSQFGLFAEAQPQAILIVLAGTLVTKVRAGVNLHF